MKRLLLFALSLMAVTGVLRAQNSPHWSYTGGAYDNETFIYAELVLNGVKVYDQSTYNGYEFAAFIDDELRGKATVVLNVGVKTTEAYMLRFRVDGSLDPDDGDEGKAITFKAYNPSTDLEYDLTVNTEQPMFTGETVETPSTAAQLELTEPTGISLSDIVVNVGETVDPLRFVTVTPEGATVPNNIGWAYGQGGNDYYSFKNTNGVWGIKGLNPTTTGASVWVTSKSMDAEGKVFVYQPATAINRTQAELTVYVDDEVTDLLQATYTLTPQNTTDQVKWESGNTDVVNVEKSGYGWFAVAAGDAVMTATVVDQNGDARDGIAPITVTVHVRQNVTEITTPFYGNADEPKYLECSVGDNLKDYFADGTAFNVLPGNAYDKSVSFVLDQGVQEYVTIDDEDNINITKAGEFYIKVKSESNPNVIGEVYIRAYNEVKDVTFKENELTLNLTSDGDIDITREVRANFNVQPGTADWFMNVSDCGATLSSSNPEVVTVENGSCFLDPDLPFTVIAKQAGTATITLEFSSKDYLAETFNFTERWGGSFTKTFTINMTCGVTDITSPFQADAEGVPYEYLDCMVGDDLTPYFVDGKAFNIVPAAATNKEVTVSYYFTDNGGEERAVTIGPEGTLTASREGSEWIRVTSVDNEEASTYVKVRVHNDVKTLTAPAPAEYTVMYSGSPVNINEIVDNAIVMGPEGATGLAGTDLANMYTFSDPDVVEITENGVFAKAVGTSTVTMTIKWKDWLAAEFDPTGAPHETEVSATFTLIVSEGLSSLSVTYEAPNPSAGNYDGKLVVTPEPAGCTLDPDLMRVSTTYYDNDDWSGYMDNILEIGEFTAGDEGSVEASVTLKNIPGRVMFTAAYPVGDDNISRTTDPQDLGYEFKINGGWEWRTIPYGVFNSLDDVIPSGLIEIRTQGEQVYNDPTYGLFGDLDLLSQNVCFKLKTTDAVQEDNSQYLYGGTLGQNDPITLRRGWNWIPNPYVFRRYIFNGLPGTFVEGDRIVSKEDGFAVYDEGSWTGNLDVLAPGQGYLFYNAGDAGRTISFQNELNLAAQDDDHVDRARQAGRHVARTSLYQYNASAFRDNMTIVAEVEGLQKTDGCRIYAFVDDECRGEGVLVGGRFFITVHGNSGETISFQLHDETVGELSQIDETTRMKNMLGTVKEPFKLHKGETIMAATAITTHTSSVNSNGTRTYDLNGREVSRPQKGVSIRRTADGRVTKTVVR